MSHGSFVSLPEGAEIFRTARRHGGHLPQGAVVPDPEWLKPTKADETAAGLSKRRPGLSAWDVSKTKVDEALAIRKQREEERAKQEDREPRDFGEQEAFSCSIATLLKATSEFEAANEPLCVDLEFVYDSLTPKGVEQASEPSAADGPQNIPGEDGHVLIEGLAAPPDAGKPIKARYKELRSELVTHFKPHC